MTIDVLRFQYQKRYIFVLGGLFSNVFFGCGFIASRGFNINAVLTDIP